jgi:hypothetical protein
VENIQRLNVSESPTTFETPTNQAFRVLGARAPGQHWSQFDVPREQANAGQATLLVTTTWNFHWRQDKGHRTPTEPAISRDSTDGTLWYRMGKPLKGAPVTAAAHWKRLTLARENGIRIIGVLKDFRSSRCSLNHVFDCDGVRDEVDGSAMWLRLRPRGQVGCEVGSVDIREVTMESQEDCPDRTLVESLVRPRVPANGQGWGGTAESRKAIEKHAMDLALRHYSSLWREVIDVSANQSFDLLCRDGHRELRVEVKGTTSLGLSVLLTRNEVRHAEANVHHVALFLVFEISAGASGACSGGTISVIEPWDIHQDELIPIAFECRLRSRPSDDLQPTAAGAIIRRRG